MTVNYQNMKKNPIKIFKKKVNLVRFHLENIMNL